MLASKVDFALKPILSQFLSQLRLASPQKMAHNIPYCFILCKSKIAELQNGAEIDAVRGRIPADLVCLMRFSELTWRGNSGVLQ